MESLKSKLHQVAIILIKYRLGTKDFFFSLFPYIKRNFLLEIWKGASSKILMWDIFEDIPGSLTDYETKEVIKRVKGYKSKDLFQYLTVWNRTNNITEERIERRTRFILAKEFVQKTSREIRYINQRQRSKKINAVIKSNSFIFIGIPLVLILIFRVINGLTTPNLLLNRYLHHEYPELKTSLISVNQIANFLHEESKYGFNGAICNDGWTSSSQGRGTCSHHGGVDFYFYEDDYRLTIEECRKKAEIEFTKLKVKALKKSWIE